MHRVSRHVRAAICLRIGCRVYGLREMLLVQRARVGSGARCVRKVHVVSRSRWRCRAQLVAVMSCLVVSTWLHFTANPVAVLVSVALASGVAGVAVFDAADRAAGWVCCGRCAMIFSGWGCRHCEATP